MTGPLQFHDEIRCGVVAAGGSRESALQAARSAEALGFDSIWAGDHISFHIPILESLTLLSFLAAATERITLGTAVYLVPLRPPALIAKITSTLDVFDTFRTNIETIQNHALDANREEQPFGTAAFLFTLLDDRYDVALDRAAKKLEQMYRVPFREAAAKYCLLGRPEDCLEQMQRFVASGARHFILSPLSNASDTIATVAREILPELRSLR